MTRRQQHHPSLDPTHLAAGVDTHADTHTLAILTAQGVQKLTQTFTADAAGYRDLIATLDQAGPVAVVGVEGTNSYGAGLTRALVAAGYRVQEVLRPARQTRRMSGKSDPIDAVEAARSVLADHHVSDAKDTTTPAEALRFMLTARTRLMNVSVALSNSVRSLLVTAPDAVREKYRGQATPALIKHLAASRPHPGTDSVEESAAVSLRILARAHQQARDEAADLEARMRQLLATHYPNVLAIYGAGTIVAAQLVVTAGGNPHRIRNEAAFASLCGAAPIPASSGRTNRHRLNRGGDRRGNTALHRIALIRMQRDARTQAYVERRRAEGKTTPEILRCLKRAIAREAYRALTAEQSLPATTDLRALRHAKKLTLTTVASALDTYPARISDIERKRRPLPDLTRRYEQWLNTA